MAVVVLSIGTVSCFKTVLKEFSEHLCSFGVEGVVSWFYLTILHDYRTLYTVSQKWPLSYFLNNSVKNQPILTIFGK